MMTIIFMVSVALFLSVCFVMGYFWSVSNGQFDDLATPALRMLKDDFLIQKKTERTFDDPE
jgi:cbb3-type cytochrome oxidase maturation protein